MKRNTFKRHLKIHLFNEHCDLRCDLLDIMTVLLSLHLRCYLSTPVIRHPCINTWRVKRCIRLIIIIIVLSKLGRKLADQSGDDREISFLFQRLSILFQRYNAILLHDYFVKEEEEE